MASWGGGVECGWRVEGGGCNVVDVEMEILVALEVGGGNFCLDDALDAAGRQRSARLQGSRSGSSTNCYKGPGDVAPTELLLV